MSLADKCEQLRVQLGYKAGTVLADIVSQAEADLGIQSEGNLIERCDRCCAAVGIGGGAGSAAPFVDVAHIAPVMAVPHIAPVMAVPVVDQGHVPVMAVPMGLPMEPVDTHVLTFGSCNDQSFDANGVLYNLGTDFGRAGYTNPADAGKVRLSWSPDAANYYSTNGGHKQGDAGQAARVICAQAHLGSNATMWSRGAPGAWFAIDLTSIDVRPTHFAYRNDYGGGGNHPRTFELQGSADGGQTWTTLSRHNGEAWRGKQAKHWPIHGAEQYYRIFRIVNQGAPNHLCCSGFEIYGHIRAGAPPPPPPQGPLVVHTARYGWARDIWNVQPGHGHHHGGGAKDVTDIVRGLIANDELHINPQSHGQYMNRTFWPETAGGPAIPRKLAVRYSYGEGPVHDVETPAVPHETVALHFFWWALFKKEATGPDSLKHAGCLMSPLLCPFEEYRTRIQGTNKFHKNGEPGNVDDYSSKNCACNGLSCTMRLC